MNERRTPHHKPKLTQDDRNRIYGRRGGKPFREREPERSGPPQAPDRYWLVGIHAVTCALANPWRKRHRLLATANAAEKLPEGTQAEIVERRELDRILGRDTVHQGVAMEIGPLEAPPLEQIAATRKPLLILDRVTDPHNVGAVLRTAAAFGFGAVIAPLRHSPPENATIAKTAAGAMELVPYARVKNLGEAMEQLKSLGYVTVGLEGSASTPLSAFESKKPVALVMGAEGKGMREKTALLCDVLVTIPISADMESLNVSVAAGIAMHAVAKR